MDILKILEEAKVDISVVRNVEKALKNIEENNAKALKDLEKQIKDGESRNVELTNTLKADRKAKVIAELLSGSEFDSKFIKGVEAIFKGNVEIDDKLDVKIGGKNPADFKAEFIKGEGKNFLRVEQNQGGGASNSNKEPTQKPDNKINDFDILKSFINKGNK